MASNIHNKKFKQTNASIKEEAKKLRINLELNFVYFACGKDSKGQKQTVNEVKLKMDLKDYYLDHEPIGHTFYNELTPLRDNSRATFSPFYI